jgi:protein ImuB
VESDVEGLLFFEATGLYNLYGGGLFGVLEVTRRSLFQYLHRAICDTEQGICTGVAPSRFSAHLAALEKPKGASELVVSAAELDGFLEPLSVTFLGLRRRLADLPNTLERLGIRTLGKLRSLSRASLAERFGPQGLEAHDLARGADTPLQPQGPTQPVTESIELHDSVTALQLEKMLELLTERLLQRPERRERSIRSLVVCADFADGGNWRAPAVLRQSSADSARILPTLFLKLSKLPGPPVRLALEVGDFGPPAQAQEHLADAFAGSQLRKSRLGESVKQLRGTVADDAVLRVLELDRDSPLPEKRAVLAPFERRA